MLYADMKCHIMPKPIRNLIYMGADLILISFRLCFCQAREDIYGVTNTSKEVFAMVKFVQRAAENLICARETEI